MPIVVDPAGWDRARLVDLLRYQNEAVGELLEQLRASEGAWRDPLSWMTARDLLTSLGALRDGTAADSGAAPEDLVRVVNLQYDAMLAVIDLVKSHTDVSKVPKSRTGA